MSLSCLFIHLSSNALGESVCSCSNKISCTSCFLAVSTMVFAAFLKRSSAILVLVSPHDVLLVRHSEFPLYYFSRLTYDDISSVRAAHFALCHTPFILF